MLVERGDGLDTTGTMMNLMKGQPEKIDVVTQTVPPVEKQGHGKVAKQATEEIGYSGQLKDLPVGTLKPLVPSIHGQDDHPQLENIDHDHSKPPSVYVRQLLVGNNPLENNEKNPRPKNRNQRIHYSIFMPNEKSCNHNSFRRQPEAEEQARCPFEQTRFPESMSRARRNLLDCGPSLS